MKVAVFCVAFTLSVFVSEITGGSIKKDRKSISHSFLSHTRIKTNLIEFYIGSDETRYHPDFYDEPPSKSAKTGIPQENSSAFWMDRAKTFVTKQLEKKVIKNKAKNVIYFLGDGMSIPTLSAARAYMGGEEMTLSFEEFPYTGMSKTYCLDKQVPDSACTSTAYLTGVKANYGTLGVNGHVQRGSCDAALNTTTHTHSVVKWAIDSGRAAGIVTTSRITHATPAGAYAHSADRNWESDTEAKQRCGDDTLNFDIAHQLVYGDVGSKLKVILGGGRREFLSVTEVDETGEPGKRSDDKNYIDLWKNDGKLKKSFVTNKDDLAKINPTTTDYLLGLFESSHFRYHLEAIDDGVDHIQPRLVDMVNKALDILTTYKDEGYFLFVEGAKIDIGHHKSRAKYALDETVELSTAVRAARERTSEDDTLIVVTSDHSHTMSMAGYGVSEKNKFGLKKFSNKFFCIYRISVSF